MSAKRRPRPIGPRTREHVANLCSSRAAAEAAPDFYIGNSGTHIWTSNNWTPIERDIGYQAFWIVANRDGAGFGKACINWAEAEAMVRCGWPERWPLR